MIRCGEVRIGDYTIIGSSVQAYGPGRLTIGRHCVIGAGTSINVWEDVAMGDISALGARCMIVTHGTFLPYTEGYWVKFAGVTIGSRVWIASGVFIQPGVKVGNEVFVNAMSVLKKDVPDGSVVEGFPAQVVARVDQLRRKMTPQRIDAAARMMLDHFAGVGLRRERGVDAKIETSGRLGFRYHGQEYLVACIPSEGPLPSADEYGGGKRVIFLVNRPGWAPPADMKDPMLIDLTTMRMRHSGDPIYTALEHFLSGYYSLKLEYSEEKK
jgi:acetyltransferase-like isoleucine patch superfamily enzyme